MLSAKDAYKKTKEVYKKECGYEISEILSAVNFAASVGDTSMIRKIKSKDTLETLSELGYKITDTFFGYYVISWKNAQEDRDGKNR